MIVKSNRIIQVKYKQYSNLLQSDNNNKAGTAVILVVDMVLLCKKPHRNRTCCTLAKLVAYRRLERCHQSQPGSTAAVT